MCYYPENSEKQQKQHIDDAMPLICDNAPKQTWKRKNSNCKTAGNKIIFISFKSKPVQETIWPYYYIPL